MRQKLFFILLAAFLFLSPSRLLAEDISTILTGKVIPPVIRPIPVPFNAIVEEVLVRPGMEVEKGAPLLKFRLQDEAERNLQREVNDGARTEELKGQILDMQRQISTVQAERNKTRQLVSTGLGSKQALNRLEETLKSLQNRIELLRVTINKNEHTFESRLDELGQYFGSPLKEGQQLPPILTLHSPISGYVLSLGSALNPGQMLTAGTQAIQVGQLNPVLIQIPVYEGEINNIKVGDTVTVEIPSLKNRHFKGEVTEISWISSSMDVSKPSYYTVEVTVPNPDLLLKPGFKAVVRF